MKTLCSSKAGGSSWSSTHVDGKIDDDISAAVFSQEFKSERSVELILLYGSELSECQ